MLTLFPHAIPNNASNASYANCSFIYTVHGLRNLDFHLLLLTFLAIFATCQYLESLDNDETYLALEASVSSSGHLFLVALHWRLSVSSDASHSHKALTIEASPSGVHLCHPTFLSLETSSEGLSDRLSSLDSMRQSRDRPIVVEESCYRSEALPD